MNLVLGTAQLGMNYGVVNRTGKPNRADAVALVRRARAAGVTVFDTARAYGDAEDILGEALDGEGGATVITKLQLPELLPDARPGDVRACVDRSVSESSKKLRLSRLPVLLLHRWQHFRAYGGTVWQRLTELRNQDRIGALGASVYTPEEALDALAEPQIQHLQIPFNLLDWRWTAMGLDRAVLSHGRVVVHARSVFLQGLLLAGSPADWPKVIGFDPTRTVECLGKFVTQFRRANLADLCLAYLRAQEWISTAVVGCETAAQLEENLHLSRLPGLTKQQANELQRSLPVAPSDLLSPTKWTPQVPADL